MRPLLSLALAALGQLCVGRALAQDMVVNGGFETATVGVPDGTHFPAYPAVLDGWGAVNTDGEFILGGEQAHSGTGFMSLLNNGDANPGLPWLGADHVQGGFDRSEQVVEVAPSTQYVLRYWYRGGDGSRFGYLEGGALVQVEETAPLHTSLGTRETSCTGTWQKDSIAFTTGINTTQVILLFSALGATPTDTWYDDVSLRTKFPTSAGIDEQRTAFTTAFDPSAQAIRITSSASLEGRTAQLLNAAGAEVQAPSPLRGTSAAVDVAGLADGLYVLVLSDVNGREARRIVITH